MALKYMGPMAICRISSSTPARISAPMSGGGSIENRSRFLLAITDAVISVWGADRVGIRLSPTNQHGDIEDNNRWETYSYAVEQLNKRRPAYLHLVSPRVSGNLDVTTELDLGPNRFRPLITGDTRLIAAGGYKPADAEELLRRGDADARGVRPSLPCQPGPSAPHSRGCCHECVRP